MASGTAGISQRLVTRQQGIHIPLVIKLIDVGRSIVPINGDDQRKPDRGFRRGNGDRKDCDDYPGGLIRFGTEPPERNEIQVRCCEHHLDADQNENRMPPAERGEQTDAEKRCGYDEEDLECMGQSLPFLTAFPPSRG